MLFEAVPVLLTKQLDETIRRAEIAGIGRGIESAWRLQPDAGAESIEVAGGLIVFTGIESPLSQAFGVGTLGPITDDEVAAITTFYEARGTTPRVFVSPMADPTLGHTLVAAGYAPSEHENVLACDDLHTHAVRDDRIAIAKDLHAWARASAEAFKGGDEVQPGDDFIALLIASSEGVIALEAIEDGQVVATAAMDVRAQCAALFAGSTAPRFRQRGWHLAMIRDRIARAREAGARLMRATAKPASISEHNFHRCGFMTLYTRTLWERKARTLEAT